MILIFEMILWPLYPSICKHACIVVSSYTSTNGDTIDYHKRDLGVVSLEEGAFLLLLSLVSSPLP